FVRLRVLHVFVVHLASSSRVVKRACATVAVFVALLSPCLAWSVAATGPTLPTLPSRGTRGPSALAFSADGKQLYVAEQGVDQVAILDPDSGKTLAQIPSGGAQPTGLALSADGRTLAVANSFSGSLGILDLEERALRASVRIPGGPWDVAIGGGQAFVSVSQ